MSTKSSKYGRIIKTRPEWNIRLYMDVPRGTDAYKKIYSQHTATERINNRILNDYGLHRMMIHRKEHYSFYHDRHLYPFGWSLQTADRLLMTAYFISDFLTSYSTEGLKVISLSSLIFSLCHLKSSTIASTSFFSGSGSSFLDCLLSFRDHSI